MIYFIRHGQTDKNKEMVLQGRSNAPLNQQGVQEARTLAAYFQKHQVVFTRCYTSPLIRAVTTGQLVSGLPEEALIRDDRLLEMDYGPYERASLEHPPREILEFFQDFVHNPAPFGMESLDQVVKRQERFLQDLIYQPGENILVSMHAISMKAALEYLTPESNGSFWGRHLKNCAVYYVERQGTEYSLPQELKMETGSRET